jgi:hypothetical protein
MRPRRARGEDGASLALALGFLLLFSLTIPALLNLGTTNLLITARFSEHRAAIYAADGATDAAVQYLRLNTGCGRQFQTAATCPIYTTASTSTFQATVNGKTATVLITGTGNPLALDRTVTLATTVAGVSTRVNATVVIHDANNPANPTPGNVTTAPVDVQSWTLTR